MTDRAVVAAVQFHTRTRQPDADAETALAMVTEAARRGAALAVLPEYCLSGYEHTWVADGAPGAAADSTFLGELTRAVDHLGIAVVLGDLERVGGRLYSTSYMPAGGQVVGRHRKSILTESEAGSGLTRGDSAATPVALPGLPVPVAPMVCFEHGFPEIALDLAAGRRRRDRHLLRHRDRGDQGPSLP